MKTITIHIDDTIYEEMLRDAALVVFAQDCVHQTMLEKVAANIIQKIYEGKDEATILEP